MAREISALKFKYQVQILCKLGSGLDHYIRPILISISKFDWVRPCHAGIMFKYYNMSWVPFSQDMSQLNLEQWTQAQLVGPRLKFDV